MFARFWSPLFVTVATFCHFSSQSPLLGCDAFFTSPLPCRVAFASTLIYDPSHNLHGPCSTQETGGKHSMFALFWSSLVVTCCYSRHFWVVIKCSVLRSVTTWKGVGYVIGLYSRVGFTQIIQFATDWFHQVFHMWKNGVADRESDDGNDQMWKVTIPIPGDAVYE